jgi:hypothetical protein
MHPITFTDENKEEENVYRTKPLRIVISESDEEIDVFTITPLEKKRRLVSLFPIKFEKNSELTGISTQSDIDVSLSLIKTETSFEDQEKTSSSLIKKEPSSIADGETISSPGMSAQSDINVYTSLIKIEPSSLKDEEKTFPSLIKKETSSIENGENISSPNLTAQSTLDCSTSGIKTESTIESTEERSPSHSRSAWDYSSNESKTGAKYRSPFLPRIETSPKIEDSTKITYHPPKSPLSVKMESPLKQNCNEKLSKRLTTTILDQPGRPKRNRKSSNFCSICD